MLGLVLSLALAHATDFYVESDPVADRDAATAMWDKARAAGMAPRLVRRFRLGHGWEFVLLVEGMTDEAAARTTAEHLSDVLDARVTVFREGEGSKAVPVIGPEPAPESPAMTAGQWLAKVDASLGGAAGGAGELGRAGAVHFVFTRTLKVGDREATIRHDYWREGGYRRLAITTGGAGKDSVAIVTPTGAWISVNGAATSRDIGVAVGAVDNFAPEAVLTIALEGHALLRSPEAQRFQVLEGAESGLRLGLGADGPDQGLTFIDIDPDSARLLRARYVTEAGPIEWDLRDWKRIGSAVMVPYDVRMVRGDGTTEKIKVDSIEIVGRAPEGTFAAPVR